MTKKNTFEHSDLHTMACTGCGRHKKQVGTSVTAYFCNHCFTMTGNYNRYKRDFPLVQPLLHIHVKDVLVGVNGKKYKVLSKAEVFNEDKLYQVVEVGTKEVITLGDYFFVSKDAE